jgi:MFS family permease
VSILNRSKLKELPANLWVASATSFLTDISSEMVINILPLFLSAVLGVKTNIIGIIEGIAEATSSILKVFSGWLSDRLRTRKWLAVAGYGLSALAKPFFYFANSWGAVAGGRWADRVGKGVRTAPRDALVADNVKPEQRGLAFGLHRAADTAGALLGILIAAFIVWKLQAGSSVLAEHTFRTVVLISLIPAFLAVIVLAVGTKEVKVEGEVRKVRISLKGLGRNFIIFLVIVGIFDLGNSSDAFLVLRAQERGMSALNILIMLAAFNLIYTVISTPAGALSDKLGRRRLIIGGWIVYALIYLGFALAQSAVQIWLLYAAYGLYYGMAYGTAKAMVADLVPAEMRGPLLGLTMPSWAFWIFPRPLLPGCCGAARAPGRVLDLGSVLLRGGHGAAGVVLFIFWKPKPLQVEQAGG